MTTQFGERLRSGLTLAAFLQFFFCVILAVAIPKATTVSLAILLCGSLFLLLVWVQSSNWLLTLRELPKKWLWLILLPILVGISGLWSEDPNDAFVAAMTLAFVLLAYGTIVAATPLVPLPVQRCCQIGYIAGVSLAIGLAVIDVVSDQGISRWVFTTWPNLPEAKAPHVFFEDGKAVFVSVATPNRRAIVLVCLLPAFAYCLSQLRLLSPSLLIALIGLSGFAILLVYTHSQTTQMAFGVGAVIFIGAMYLPRVTRTSMAIIWTTVWLVTVPVAIGMGEIRLQDSKWLPVSLTERVKIWSQVGRDILDRPFLGHGVGVQAMRDDTGPTEELLAGKLHPVNHPHNAYLQVWQELGVVGALLFLAFGLWLLRSIDKLQDELQPYFLGMFGMYAAVISTGYGIWQHWHLSAFALGAALLWIVTKEERSNEKPRIQ